MEAEYCTYLGLRKRAAEIFDYEHHPLPVILHDSPMKEMWKVDFRVWVTAEDKPEYHEVKGYHKNLREFQRKRRTFEALYGAHRLKVVRRKGRGWMEI